ncbi:dihydrolipoyllysine-residue acetyltransferase [Arenicella xantha]
MSKSANIEISVPDIGTDSAKVIEILVSVGDTIAVEDPIITLESDKASMDVPSTHAGVVKAISVTVDQDIAEGTVILELTPASNEDQTADASTKSQAPQAAKPAAAPQKVDDQQQNSSTGSQLEEVRIPDIGGDSAKVIEILVEVGQSVEIEDPLVTLESDKASMDVPSSSAGTIESIEVKIDDEVGEGTLVVTVKSSATQSANTAQPSAPAARTESTSEAASTPAKTTDAPAAKPTQEQQGAPAAPSGQSYASPSIRRFARELGVELSKVSGTGRKQRVTHDDVKAHVKSAMTSQAKPAATSGSGIPPIPAQDFSKFGEIELQPLNKIKRLTAANLHRSWVNVPHVTHNDESDISDLESFRKQLNSEYQKQGKDIKLSPLAFIVKAVVNAMQAYPQFNSSLEPGGENLILKKYFNIGIAVETPNGLVVPVLKDADKKSVAEIAREMSELAAKARDKKLTMSDMSGACFTISSLGGIGGTGFTPIVNAPEVAILGVSRTKIQPVWNGEEFKPGMILPLSLSYDHRVIDGAEAARFARHIAAVLEDVRRLTV